MKFISTLILIALLRPGRSAPSSSIDPVYTDGTHVGHKTKRSANLLNFVRNMLQKHFCVVDREWTGFPNMFSYGYNYGTRNWNSYDDTDLQCSGENNFLENDEQSDISFSEEDVEVPPFLDLNYQYNLDTNCPTYGNDDSYQEQKNFDMFPFSEVTYQYDTSSRNDNWNLKSGRGFNDNDDPERWVYGPKSDSVDIDWNKTIPPQRNVELDEVILKNFYMTPPQMDTRVGNPFLHNDLTPGGRNWQTEGTHFLPDNQEVAQQNPNNLPQFDVLNCFPVPAEKGVVNPVLDPRQFEQGSTRKILEDDYIVLLIKKDHVLGDKRTNDPGRTKSIDEDLCSNGSKASNESVSQKPADEDISVPCDTTSEDTTTTTTTESAPTTTQTDKDCTASNEFVNGIPPDTTYANIAPESPPVTGCPTESITDATDNVIVGSVVGAETVEHLTENIDDVFTKEVITERNGEGDAFTSQMGTTPSHTNTPSTTNGFEASEYETSDSRKPKDDTKNTEDEDTGGLANMPTSNNVDQSSSVTKGYEPADVTEDTEDDQLVGVTKIYDADGGDSTFPNDNTVTDSVSQSPQSPTDTSSDAEENVTENEDTEGKEMVVPSENFDPESGGAIYSTGDSVGDSVSQDSQSHITATLSEHESISSGTNNFKDATEDTEDKQPVVLSKDHKDQDGGSTYTTDDAVSDSVTQDVQHSATYASSDTASHEDANSDEGYPVDFTENAEDRYMSVFTKKYRGGEEGSGGSTYSNGGTVRDSANQDSQSPTGTSIDAKAESSDERDLGDANEHAKKEQTVVVRKSYGAGEGESTYATGSTVGGSESQNVPDITASDTTGPMETEHKDGNSDEGFPTDFTEKAEAGDM